MGEFAATIKRNDISLTKDIGLPLLGNAIFSFFIYPIIDEYLRIGLPFFKLFIAILFPIAALVAVRYVYRRSLSARFKIISTALIIAVLATALIISYKTLFPQPTSPSIVFLFPSEFANSFLNDRLTDARHHLPDFVDTPIGPLKIVQHPHNIRPGYPVLENFLVEHILKDENALGVIILYESGNSFKIAILNSIDEILRRDEIQLSAYSRSEIKDDAGYTPEVGVSVGYPGVTMDRSIKLEILPSVMAPNAISNIKFVESEDTSDFLDGLQFYSADVLEQDIYGALVISIKRFAFLFAINYGNPVNACDAYLDAAIVQKSIRLSSERGYLHDLSVCAQHRPQRVASTYTDLLKSTEIPEFNKMIVAEDLARLIMTSPESLSLPYLQGGHSENFYLSEIKKVKELHDICGVKFPEARLLGGDNNEDFHGLGECINAALKASNTPKQTLDSWSSIYTDISLSLLRVKDYKNLTENIAIRPEICESVFFYELVYLIKQGMLPSLETLELAIENKDVFTGNDPQVCVDTLTKITDGKTSTSETDIRRLFKLFGRLVSESTQNNSRAVSGVLYALNLITNTHGENFDKELYFSTIKMMYDNMEESLLEYQPKTLKARSLLNDVKNLLSYFRELVDLAASGQEPLLGFEPISFLDSEEITRAPLLWVESILLRSAKAGKEQGKKKEAMIAEIRSFLTRYPNWKEGRHIAFVSLQLLSAWDDIIALSSGETQAEQLARAFAYARKGNAFASRDIYSDLAERSEETWERDSLYLKMVEATPAHPRKSCISGFTSSDLDSIRELFGILYQGFDLSKPEFRRLIFGLIKLREKSQQRDMPYEIDRKARVIYKEAIKDNAAQSKIESLSNKRRGIVVLGVSLYAFAQSIAAQNCPPNLGCPWVIISTVAASQAGVVGNLDLSAIGCELKP